MTGGGCKIVMVVGSWLSAEYEEVTQLLRSEPPQKIAQETIASVLFCLMIIGATRCFLNFPQISFIVAMGHVCMSAQFLQVYDIHDRAEEGQEGPSPFFYTCLWKLGMGCLAGAFINRLFYILNLLSVWCNAPSLYICVPFTDALILTVLTSLISIVVPYIVHEVKNIVTV